MRQCGEVRDPPVAVDQIQLFIAQHGSLKPRYHGQMVFSRHAGAGGDAMDLVGIGDAGARTRAENALRRLPKSMHHAQLIQQLKGLADEAAMRQGLENRRG